LFNKTIGYIKQNIIFRYCLFVKTLKKLTMNSKTLSIRNVVLMTTLLVVLFASCKKNEDVVTAPVEEANIIIKHASPDAPNVDLLVDGVKINTSAVGFNTNTGYLKIKAGARNIKVNAVGSTTSVINSNLTLAKDKNYTLYAANRLSNIEPVLVEDNLTAPAAGKAHIRFVHLSPDAPAVNIVNGAATTNLFSSVAFKSSTAFTPVDATAAGTAFTFNIRNATTTASVASVPVTLVAGKIYTIVIRGFVTPPTNNTNSLGTTLITNK
jgi:hypothetical protein